MPRKGQRGRRGGKAKVFEAHNEDEPGEGSLQPQSATGNPSHMAQSGQLHRTRERHDQVRFGPMGGLERRRGGVDDDRAASDSDGVREGSVEDIPVDPLAAQHFTGYRPSATDAPSSSVSRASSSDNETARGRRGQREGGRRSPLSPPDPRQGTSAFTPSASSESLGGSSRRHGFGGVEGPRGRHQRLTGGRRDATDSTSNDEKGNRDDNDRDSESVAGGEDGIEDAQVDRYGPNRRRYGSTTEEQQQQQQQRSSDETDANAVISESSSPFTPSNRTKSDEDGAATAYIATTTQRRGQHLAAHAQQYFAFETHGAQAPPVWRSTTINTAGATASSGSGQSQRNTRRHVQDTAEEEVSDSSDFASSALGESPAPPALGRASRPGQGSSTKQSWAAMRRFGSHEARGEDALRDDDADLTVEEEPTDADTASQHLPQRPPKSSGAVDEEEDDGRAEASVAPASAAATAAIDAGGEERPDPVRIITGMLLVEGGRKTLSQIADALEWGRIYEPYFGELREYVTTYQSIFLLSPVGELVVLRQLALETGHRRPMRPTMKTNIASSIGSCAYTVVSKALDLTFLEGLYTCRGLRAQRLTDEVLHISAKGENFDVFLFVDGGIVWWGMERSDHWLIEDDFLADAVATRQGIVERYAQHDIDHLYPVWFTFHVDASCDNDSVMEKLEENICFDHFVLPGSRLRETREVKLAISHALSNAARVDYFEYVTQSYHDHVIRSTQEQRQPLLWRYRERKRELLKIEGALQANVQMMDDIGDSTLLTFFWENPRYTNIYKLTMEMQSVMLRKAWFSSKCEAAIELVRMADNKLHRMFMIRSDWVLILTLLADVFFLLMRLVYAMYFRNFEDAY